MINIIIIVLLLVLLGRVDVFILVFLLCVIAFHKGYVAMLWRLCISASFVRACTDVSHVVGEGVELTVHKESVVVEEIKEVELRSRCVQFIYDRNYNRNEEFDEK